MKGCLLSNAIFRYKGDRIHAMPNGAGPFHVHVTRGDVLESYKKEEVRAALQVVSSTIIKSEKSQQKFKEGTPQHTLLKNRIKAMNISKSLLTNESVTDKYTKDELIEGLRPVTSIISKCEKALPKFAGGTSHHTRFKNLIKAMNISKSLITDEINKRG